MRIAKIGNITLDYKMWIDGYQRSNGVTAEVVSNLDGGVIVFEQITRLSTENVTLTSDADGWQTLSTVEALVALANASLGQTIVVEDEFGGTFNARFRHEQNGGAVQFNMLFNAKLCDWYSGEIYLAKV